MLECFLPTHKHQHAFDDKCGVFKCSAWMIYTWRVEAPYMVRRSDISSKQMSCNALKNRIAYMLLYLSLYIYIYIIRSGYQIRCISLNKSTKNMKLLYLLQIWKINAVQFPQWEHSRKITYSYIMEKRFPYGLILKGKLVSVGYMYSFVGTQSWNGWPYRCKVCILLIVEES